jgi:hypothetical protein
LREHASPSLHALPFDFTGWLHTPVALSHTPASWHWSSAAHTVALPDTHTPAWHASFTEHASPSLQLVPSATAGALHLPDVLLHTPAAWHESAAVHTTELLLTH